MKNTPIKNHLLSYCAASALFALMAFSAGEAHAGLHVSGGFPSPAGARVTIHYDSAGFPIWGYSPCGRPIYAYSPSGAPIYIIGGIYRGCHVPPWHPHPHDRGSCRPVDIYRTHYQPRHRHARPYPPPPRHCHSCSPRPRSMPPPPRFYRHR